MRRVNTGNFMLDIPHFQGETLAEQNLTPVYCLAMRDNRHVHRLVSWPKKQKTSSWKTLQQKYSLVCHDDQVNYESSLTY